MMRIKTLLLSLLLTIVSAAWADCKERVLFSFDEAGAAGQWRNVNDGVMGGRSDGRFKIDEERLRFFGNLSLANNGGFASVRALGKNLGLKAGDTVHVRLRGDGREYTLNLYTPTRRTAFSYRVRFKTQKDKWLDVRVPVEKFQATWFGRAVANQPLDPTQVSGIGVLLGDKKPGSFQLEVDWIKVSSPDE